MEEDDRLRLQTNRIFLVENLKVKDIQDRLVSEFILSEEDEENLGRVNSFEAVRLLIKYLNKSSNPRAYKVFCQALDEKGYDFIVEQLSSTNIQRVREKAKLDKKQKDDQLEKLQKQVWLQTEMMMDMKKELDELKSRENVPKVEEQKYANVLSLETKLKEQGISSDEVIDMMMKFMKSGGFSNQYVKSMPDEITIDNSVGDSEDVFEQSDAVADDELKIQSEMSIIAREIGTDIAFYMVMKKNGMAPVEPRNKYALEFRKLVDEVNEQYEDLFIELVQKVNLDETSGFQAFVQMANEFFRDGNYNWGRIVVIYTYVGWLAVNMYSENERKTWESIYTLGDFLGYYISQKIGGWIEEQGGWEKFIERFSKEGESRDKSYWSTVMLGSLGLGVVLGLSLFKN